MGPSDARSAPLSPPVGIIGMIHLPPLPGAPEWGGDMGMVLDRARKDAEALHAGGVDAMLVENYNDSPFHKAVGPETVAAMTAAAQVVHRSTDKPVGVNVLRNDAAAALAVAAATGAAFIRVNIHTGGMFTDQGWIEGRAADTLRLRQRLAPTVAILVDVMVKHASPPPGLTIEQAARDAAERGRADALIVSGAATGSPASLEDVRVVSAAVPELPILVGSGVSAETVVSTLERADGVIAGSALMKDGRPGGPAVLERVRRLVDAASDA